MRRAFLLLFLLISGGWLCSGCAAPVAGVTPGIQVHHACDCWMNQVFFARDEVRISDVQRQAVNANLQCLRSCERTLPPLELDGHADADEANPVAVGLQRAQAVQRVLIILGVDPQTLTVRSFGKSRPVRQGQTEQDQAHNRRVEFVVKTSPGSR